MMKSVLLFVFLGSAMPAVADDLSFDDALKVLDQYAVKLSKVEIGMSLVNERFEMKPGCTNQEKTVSTIVELGPDFALVLNEKKSTPCGGTETTTRFLSRDYRVNYAIFRSEVAETLKDWKATRRDNILSFNQSAGGHAYTMEFDLNTNLFANWVHYHDHYADIQDHNIQYSASSRIVPIGERQGLPTCERRAITLGVERCN